MPGWRPWRDAWSDALYGPHGFYCRSEGPSGHFATSASAGSGVVDEFAAAILRLAAEHGCTTIVDLGAGRGELLRAVADSPTARRGRHAQPLRLLAVDVVARPAGLPTDVGWLASPGGAELPPELENLTDTLVLANEWLDVVPLDILEVDPAGTPRLVEVDRDGAERLGRALSTSSTAATEDAQLLDWCRQWWPWEGAPPGSRIEVGSTRDRAFAELCGRVRSGLVVAVDYGHERGARPTAGTLAAYRSGRAVPPVPDGSCDLTAHVALDSIAASAHAQVSTQRGALQRLGVDGRLGQPQPDGDGTAPDPAAYLRELQRSSAAAVLLDRGGLGGFGWVVWPAAPPEAIGQPDQPAERLVR